MPDNLETIGDETFRGCSSLKEITLPSSLKSLGKYAFMSCSSLEDITFEGLKINGRRLYDKMKGKPAWYATGDYIPMYVGNHVENVVFY